jgi:hypothetical protein
MYRDTNCHYVFTIQIRTPDVESKCRLVQGWFPLQYLLKAAIEREEDLAEIKGFVVRNAAHADDGFRMAYQKGLVSPVPMVINLDGVLHRNPAYTNSGIHIPAFDHAMQWQLSVWPMDDCFGFSMRIQDFLEEALAGFLPGRIAIRGALELEVEMNGDSSGGDGRHLWSYFRDDSKYATVLLHKLVATVNEGYFRELRRLATCQCETRSTRSKNYKLDLANSADRRIAQRELARAYEYGLQGRSWAKVSIRLPNADADLAYNLPAVFKEAKLPAVGELSFKVDDRGLYKRHTQSECARGVCPTVLEFQRGHRNKLNNMWKTLARRDREIRRAELLTRFVRVLRKHKAFKEYADAWCRVIKLAVYIWDLNRDEFVAEEEFTQCVLFWNAASTVEKRHFLFYAFDRGSKNGLDRDELEEMLSKLMDAFPSNCQLNICSRCGDGGPNKPPFRGKKLIQCTHWSCMSGGSHLFVLCNMCSKSARDFYKAADRPWRGDLPSHTAEHLDFIREVEVPRREIDLHASAMLAMNPYGDDLNLEQFQSFLASQHPVSGLLDMSITALSQLAGLLLERMQSLLPYDEVVHHDD